MALVSTNRYRWVIEASLLPLQVAIGLNFLAPAPLFPLIMEDFGLERGTVSLLVASVTVMMAIVTLPAGVAAARVGLKRSLALGGLLMSAGLLAPLAPNFAAVVLLRILFGIGAGITLPVTSAIVMQWFGAKELPLLNGVNVAGQSVGVATSMFIGVPLANALGWQFPLFLYGAATFGGLVTWMIVGREPEIEGPPPSAPSLGTLLAVLKLRTTLLLQLAVTGAFAAYVAFSSWLPTYYNEELDMSLTQAGAIAGLLPLVGIVATFAGAALPARLGLRRPFLIVPGMFYGVAAFGAFFFDNLAIIYPSIILLGICGWIYLPSLFTIPMEMPGMTPEKVAVVVGAALMVGNFASFLSPILVGMTTDAVGSFVPAFIGVAIVSSLLLVAGLLLPETGPRGKRHSAPAVEAGDVGPA